MEESEFIPRGVLNYKTWLLLMLQNKNTTKNSICSPAELLCPWYEAVDSLVNCTEFAATNQGNNNSNNNNNKTAFPWVSHIISLSFSFLICKMGQTMPISQGCLGRKYYTIWKALAQHSKEWYLFQFLIIAVALETKAPLCCILHKMEHLIY